jgi:release factor glutamine methyltransferase
MQADFERRGIDTPRLDADLLVAHALGVKRITLFLDPERPLIEAELTTIRALVERRRAHEPIAYILGEREFYGRSFVVTPDVLIPRPDTETLVEAALAFLRANTVVGPVVDLCTGSGAVALTLAAECSDRELVATDVSPAALSVAQQNVDQLGLAERVALRLGDLFAALDSASRFACITVNPPYIGAHELVTLHPGVRDFEPQLALDAGTDALSFYRRIAESAARYLVPGGALMVEVGIGQAQAVSALFAAAGFGDLRTRRDLGGVDRVVTGTHAGKQ